MIQKVVGSMNRDDFYVLMQKSLNDEFPEYEVKMEKRDKEYFMILRDKDY
ncbi:hypothetical protein [Pedobacter frigoris]|nr:hypothetical protein [Pedobacter frigoris]